MKKAMSVFAFVGGAAVAVAAAPETWTGKISDAHCGAKHATEGKKMTDRECTEKCA